MKGPAYQAVMMILTGSATVVYKDRSGVAHDILELRQGEVIGLSDLVQVAGFEYFGDIRAEDGLECLVVEEPDQVFELYERQLLAQGVQDATNVCKRVMETKFKYLTRHRDLYHYY